MSWNKGQDTVEDLLAKAHLEQVRRTRPRRNTCWRVPATLGTAVREASTDPAIAYDALYAAARKALTSVLRQQGLRPTRTGGHEVVIQVAEAQLVPPLVSMQRRWPRCGGQAQYGYMWSMTTRAR